MDCLDGMNVQQVICVYMQYGDDFLESIQKAARDHDVHTGVVLSGIGTFDKARIHYITHTHFPSEDKFVELEGPIELCNVDGIIADYQPHLHGTMAVRGEQLFAGHIEPGCRVLYLAEVAIAKLSGRRLVRRRHPELGTPRLEAE